MMAVAHTELSSTLEDYLRAVYRIESKKRVARPRDICELQGVAASTVTAALRSLADKGLINYEPYEVITLSEAGRTRAERLVARHRIIRDFLEGILGFELERSDAIACGMEHAIDEDGLQRLVCFLAFMKQHSEEGRRCLAHFREFVRGKQGQQSCEQCVREYMEKAEEADK